MSTKTKNFLGVRRNSKKPKKATRIVEDLANVALAGATGGVSRAARAALEIADIRAGRPFAAKIRQYANRESELPYSQRSDPVTRSAPVVLGLQQKPSFLRRGGKAQVNTDLSGKGQIIDSERVSFSDMVTYTVQLDATPHAQLPLYSGSAYYGNVAISPKFMSARLVQLEEMYSYYAFRELNFEYCPVTGTNTTGNVAFSIDMGVDAAPSSTTGITFVQVMQHAIAVSTPVWAPKKWKFTFAGTKLWDSSTTGTADVASNIQALLWAALFNGVATGIYGQIHVSGIVDFYKQQEVNSVPALLEKKVWDNFCHTKWVVYTLAREEQLTYPEFLRRYREQIIANERLRFSIEVLKEKNKPLLLFDSDSKSEKKEK